MKICCYEEFITKSSGTTSMSDCGDFGQNQHPGLCKGGKCAPSLEIYGQNGLFERGTSPSSLPSSTIQENRSPKAVRVDFCMFIGTGCSVVQRLLILKVPFCFPERCSHCKCHAVVGGRGKEPEPCSFPAQKQRSVLLVPFIQLRG